MVQIKWTLIALTDLREIYNYISRDSPKFAKLQVIKIKSRTSVLKNLPRSGKRVQEFNFEHYRELIEGNYRIIYKIVSPVQIDILTVHHSSRDFNKRGLK